jgi:uncharacterized membrane protein HdeD (DUF308 family)
MAYGVIAILFGVVAVFQPLTAIAALTWIMGIMALAEGITSLFTLTTAPGGFARGWLMFYGGISVLFGLIAVLDPLSAASALLMLLGFWLVVAGIHRLLLGLRVRRHVPGEGWTVLSGVLALVLGVIFVVSPLSGLEVTAIWIGAIALLYGVVQVMAALRLRRLL